MNVTSNEMIRYFQIAIEYFEMRCKFENMLNLTFRESFEFIHKSIAV